MSSDSLRVAQVMAGAQHGGAENFFVRLTAGLHEQPDLQAKAFIRRHPQRLATLRQQGVAADGFRFGGKLDFYDRWIFQRKLKAFRPDVVMTWMGRASAAVPRGDYVLINRLGHYYNLKYYRHADYWVGISKGICEHLLKGGMPPERVFHIPNFADESPVQALPRDSFNTPTDAPLILAAGRLHVNKGFDTLLRAVAQLPDAVLWLAGSGPEEGKLKALCRELDLDARVRFLGWRNDVTALMRSVDVFVCPSRHEGLGSIVMEAFFHRCPIVATRSQGPAEVIQQDYSGLLTEIDAPAELAAAVQRLLTESGLRQRLVANAASVYSEQFSRRVILDQYRQLYQRLAASPTAGP